MHSLNFVWISCRGQNVDRKLQVQISAGALIFLAVLLLLLPLQWVIAVLLAAIFHELCHGLAILLCGGRLDGIFISGSGAVMETTPMSAGREVFCAFAGPLGSFLLLFFARWMPRTAICGVIHGLYNLIPLFPMDGGRILRGLLYTVLFPPTAHRVFLWSQRIVAALLFIACAMLSFRIGIFGVILLIYLFWRRWRENTLAKNAFWRYNRRSTTKGVRL